MPNGFCESKEEWEQLEAPLPTIDANLKSFVHSKNLTIEKNCHNWPNISLFWESNGINRKIEIYLKNKMQKTYNICLYSWKDKDNIRFWKKRIFEEKYSISRNIK